MDAVLCFVTIFVTLYKTVVRRKPALEVDGAVWTPMAGLEAGEGVVEEAHRTEGGHMAHQPGMAVEDHLPWAGAVAGPQLTKM